MNYQKANKLANNLKRHIKGLYITGSLKRKAEIINDLDFITLRKLNDILNQFENIQLLKNGDKHISFIYNGVQYDIWKATNRYELFYKRLLRDMDKGHVIYWKNQAKKHDFKLTERGLYDNYNNLINVTNKTILKKLLNIK